MSWKGIGVALALVLAVTAPAYGFYVATAGVAGVAVSPGAAVFAFIAVVNTNPVGVGGYGDIILAIEEGRDDISPFCTLAIQMAPGNPSQAGILAAGVPPLNIGGPLWYPLAPPGFVTMQFIFRPTNDPANPGWAALPGAPNQLDNAWQTVHAVCEAFDAHRNFVPPAGVVHWIDIEFDNAPGSPSYFEMYKFRVIH